MKRLFFYLGIPLLLIPVALWIGWFLFLPPKHYKNELKDLAQQVVQKAPHNASGTYAAVQKNVIAKKTALKSSWRNKDITQTAANRETAVLFTRLFTDSLFPYWAGTPWDFNGTTQQPGEGSIACGYFATTLLRDMGVPVNRVKMAQCVSSKLIQSVVTKNNIANYSHLSLGDFIEALKKKGTGVSIIGLDFHTGFLVTDGQQCWFIHSNYIGREGVIKEPAATSAALKASKTRLAGHLTEDDDFLNKWLNR
jgi:hypothetical protein